MHSPSDRAGVSSAARLPGVTLRGFARDWLPFVGLLLSYELMRDLATVVGMAPHDMVAIERWLDDGREATLVLQSAFYHAGQVGAVDIVGSAIYFMHFVLPAAVGLYLWLGDQRRYRAFAASLLVTSGLAFLTYLTAPTEPPWLGHPQDVHKVIDETIHKLQIPGWLVSVYSDRDYNVEAAFPSLHSAFPLIAAVHVWARDWRPGLLLALWAFVVWVSVVYLGEHYVVDVLGGILYACAAMLVVLIWRRTQTSGTLSVAVPSGERRTASRR